MEAARPPRSVLAAARQIVAASGQFPMAANTRDIPWGGSAPGSGTIDLWRATNTAHVWHQRLLRSVGRDYPAEQLPLHAEFRWLPWPLRASAPPHSPAGVRWRTSSWPPSSPPIPTSTSTRSDRSSSSRSPRHVTVGRCLAEGGTEDVRASLTRSRNGSVGLALRQPRMRGGPPQPPTAERSAATQSPRSRKGSI